jgi:hypothetical protein
MNIIIPIPITDAMIGAGTTIAEPSARETAAGETAWSGSSVAYAVNAVHVRSTTHRKYRCAVAHSSAASPLPENDPTRWVDIGPTDRWAPFDKYTNTQALTTTTLTYVLSPGYFNSLALYGLVGAQYSITVKDAPGGTTIFTRSGFLTQDPLGWYEYLFVATSQINKLVFKDIPIRPTAELTITITAASGQPVGVGMIVTGDFASIVGETAEWGGTLAGATAEPVTYSYINTDEFGKTTIVRRHAATNMRCQVALPRAFADAALQRLQSVLDQPVACVATASTGYDGLNVFGLISTSPVSYDSFQNASIDINVKGLT